MSTRSTIVYVDNYHLFWDGFDQQNVYLEIESDTGTQVLKIPAIEWAELRNPKIRHSEYLDKSDSERRELLRIEVEKRIENWRESGADPKSIYALAGISTFGLMTDPIDEQVAKAMIKFGLTDC